MEMTAPGWVSTAGAVLASAFATYQMAIKAPEVKEDATRGIIELMKLKDAERDKLLTLALYRCDIRVAEVKELLGAGR